jgi:hypothetical protein
MQLKMKAKAAILMQGNSKLNLNQRVYFLVEYLDKLPSREWFFDLLWPVGKVVDFLAADASIPNNNNSSTVGMLGLYAGRDLLDYGMTLDELIKSGKLLNGDTISLQRQNLQFIKE